MCSWDGGGGGEGGVRPGDNTEVAWGRGSVEVGAVGVRGRKC